MNVAVVQPLPGIGDMIWHLPHIRAIAAHVDQPVTLVAKPRSHAGQLFSADPAIRDVMWVDRNPEGRRGRHDGPLGFPRLVRELRARRFDAVYLLHHSNTLALLLMLAGIPARYGYGFGNQHRFLSRPPKLDDAIFAWHPYDQATAWLQAADIPILDAEPVLPVLPAAAAAVLTRLTSPTPPVAIGIGSSEPYKQWGAARFAALADGLAARGFDRMILAGGAPEAGLAAEIQARALSAKIRLAIGWDLAETAALLGLARFYVGNDTGVMNMAAAVGTRTYGLFGAVAPFHHTSRIVPITPPGGISKLDGMSRITVKAVLAAIDADQAASR